MPLPKRIIWFTWKDSSHPLAGGAETVNEQIAKRLAERGCTVTFIVGGYPGSKPTEERDGYHIERVGGRWTCYYHAWRKYRQTYRGRADLVIDEVNTIPFFAGWYAGTQAVPPPRGGRLGGGGNDISSSPHPSPPPPGEGVETSQEDRKPPVVMFFHQLCREIWFSQMPQPLSTIGYLLEPLYLRLLSGNPAITVSQSTKRDLMRYGFPESRIAVITQGITLEPVGSLPPPSGGRLGGGENLSSPSPHPRIESGAGSAPPPPGEGAAGKAPRPTVLILGAIREMKRTDHAIRAYELARDVIPDLQLIVAGGNGSTYGRRVTDMIATSRYASDITYEGRVDEARKVELMRTSHVLLTCAVKEGWGLTVTEANSQGTPAIAYDADGLRDSIRDGETGLLCPPTPSDMAAAIVSLLSNDAEYQRLRRNAWEWSRTMTFDRATEDFVAAINNLASPR